ncbi:hypothetical protein YC2023_095377 [Brassica napus]
MAIKPNGKSPVTSDHDDKIMLFESPSRFNHFDNEVFSQLLASSVVQLLFLANKCERNRFWQAGNANHSASTEEGTVLLIQRERHDRSGFAAGLLLFQILRITCSEVGKGSRGDVTILPTIMINNKQPRGERSKDVLLERSVVLKDLCSGFSETTEPHICLNKDIETNECLQNNGGCWEDKTINITACRATFRGRVCQCPVVQGVKFWVKLLLLFSMIIQKAANVHLD